MFTTPEVTVAVTVAATEGTAVVMVVMAVNEATEATEEVTAQDTEVIARDIPVDMAINKASHNDNFSASSNNPT